MSGPRRLPNKFSVLSATGQAIKLDCGYTLRLGQKVYLPPVAGRKLGTVDLISMELNADTMKAEVVLRIVDSTGQGHQFRWPV